MSAPIPVWRDATPLERLAMVAITQCRYAVASPPKRFARSMAHQLDAANRNREWPIPKITDAQSLLLWRNAHHYRKQIRDTNVLAEAERRWVEHDWHEPTGVIKYPFCGKCLTIKRADGMNGPCKGPAKLRPMEKRLEPAP